jgi:hypothetical protein
VTPQTRETRKKITPCQKRKEKNTPLCQKKKKKKENKKRKKKKLRNVPIPAQSNSSLTPTR